MKSKPLVITFLPVVTFAVDCNQESTTSPQIDKPKPKPQTWRVERRDQG